MEQDNKNLNLAYGSMYDSYLSAYIKALEESKVQTEFNIKLQAAREELLTEYFGNLKNQVG